MKLPVVSSLILAGVGLSASATSQSPFLIETFEPPAYSLGDVNGQNGWTVNPGDASGIVQNEQVAFGTQALALTEGASIATARNEVNSSVFLRGMITRFQMRLGTEWLTNSGTTVDKAGAKMDVRSTTLGDFEVELGFLVAPTGGYMGVSAGESAVYLEIERGGTIFASKYHLIESSAILGSWHRFDHFYSSDTRRAQMWVDDQLVADIPVFELIDFAYGIELSNGRLGAGPASTVYFDDVSLAQSPEPGTMIALAVGGAGMVVRRVRQKKAS